MRKPLVFLLIILLPLVLSACGLAADGRNLELRQNGQTVIRVGLDGFLLDGNVTGLTSGSDGLKIDYPNGSLNWDADGLNINHAEGNIHVDGSQLRIVGKDGKEQTLGTDGDGAEFRTEAGVLVQTGEKATMPEAYPAEKLALMDGFTLNASADLGKVVVVSGFVKDTKREDVIEHYRDLLVDSDSFRQDKKGGNTLLRARLKDTDFTVFISAAANGRDTNLSIVAGE